MDPNLTPRLAPNGTLKKHHLQIRHPPPSSVYRECLKNHAASLGGHAVDGCGEFMPSPSSNPSDPSSLTCAACGCHRNFHRRLQQATATATTTEDDEDQADEYNQDNSNNNFGNFEGGAGDEAATNEDSEEDEDADNSRRRRQSGSPPPPSAPHMLLALSTGLLVGTPATAAAAAINGNNGSSGSKKRFRSKFSPEQKERMQELSERLGWRMQRRDDVSIEEACREIGVGKGVFKVWMHNNKHHQLRKSFSSAAAAAAAAADSTNTNTNNNINSNDATAPPPAARFVVGFGANGSASSLS